MSTISEVLGRRVQLKGLIGKRAMKCPYCDFYFMKNGSDLQRHIWAHEGEYSSFGMEHPSDSVLPCFTWEGFRGRPYRHMPCSSTFSRLPRKVCSRQLNSVISVTACSLASTVSRGVQFFIASVGTVVR